MAFLPDPPCPRDLATLRARALDRGRALASRARYAMNVLVATGAAALFLVLLQLPEDGYRALAPWQIATVCIGLLATAFGYRIGFFASTPAHFAANELIAAGIAPLTSSEVQSLRAASQRSPALAEAIDRRLSAGGALYTRDLHAALDHLRALSLPLPLVDEDYLRVPELAQELSN